MLNIIKNAGLSIAEFASLIGVSRIAAHNWVAIPPRAKPHKLVRPRVTAALKLLREKTQVGELPLSQDLDKEGRASEVSKLVDQTRDSF
jgi:hypothetical protein